MVEEGTKRGRRYTPDPKPETGGFFRSDHFTLAKAGIPALSFSPGQGSGQWRGGARTGISGRLYRALYHQPDDEFSADWDLSGMVADAELLHAVGLRLADSNDWPNWSADSEFRAARDRSEAERGGTVPLPPPATSAPDLRNQASEAEPMADITFYTNPMSRGQIVRWMLEEVGEPYETEMLEYGTTMKASHYLAINPMGKVPAIGHGGKVVTECAAICAYLADAFPDAGLAPPRRRARRLLSLAVLRRRPGRAAVTNKSLRVEPTKSRKTMAGYGSFDLAIDALEQALPRRTYICGDQFTAADVYVGAQIGWGMMFGT